MDTTLWIVQGLLAVIFKSGGVGKAWVSSLAPKELQGSAQGLFQGVTGGAILLAGLWAGFAWGDAGRLPLLVSGGVGLLTAGLLAVRGKALGSGT